MNEKTNPILPWINVCLIIIALLSSQYLFSSVLNLRSISQWFSTGFNLTILPGMEILRSTTIESINWFGGNEHPFSEFIKSAAVTAAGVIALFILTPWFFIRGFIRENSEHRPSGLMWYIGATVLIIGICLSTFHVVQVSMVFSDSQERMLASQKTDELRTYMMSVAFDASEWWILPEEAGGGDGSFYISDNDTLALSSLSSYDPDHSDFELSIEGTPSDSTMIIEGFVVGKENTDDEESGIKITMKITPKEDSLYTFL
jgi:hypothetical protein